MMRVKSIGKFETCRGKTYVVDEVEDIHVGDDIIIDELSFKVKEIIMNHTFSGKLAIVVC